MVSESTGKLSLWWRQPVLQRSWDLWGKVLQYVAGLTVLLDLFGETKVEMLYEHAGDARRTTVARIKELMPKSLGSSRHWFEELLWWTVPLAFVTAGFSFFWAHAYLLHYSLTLSVWLTVTGMILAPAAAIITLIQGRDRPGTGWQALKAFAGVLLTAVAIGSWIGGHKFVWWQWLFIEAGIYVLLAAAFTVALAAYSVCIGTSFLFLLIVELVLLGILFTIVRLIRLAFQRKARPLRWLAFLIFTIGFLLDFLAS